jgi:hypothetical protein
MARHRQYVGRLEENLPERALLALARYKARGLVASRDEMFQRIRVRMQELHFRSSRDAKT